MKHKLNKKTDNKKDIRSRKYSDEELHNFYKKDYCSSVLDKAPNNFYARLIPLLGLRTTDVVLDAGCGTGSLLGYIHDKVKMYYGVDFSSDLISIAKKRYLSSLKSSEKKAQFCCDTLENFCANNTQNFDKAFMVDVSEHVYDNELVLFLRGIRDVLKVNGMLYLHTPNEVFIFEKLRKLRLMRQLPQHIAVRNAKDNIALIKAAGFSKITVRYLPHYYAIVALLHPLRKIPFVGKYFEARLFIECRP